MNNNNKKNRKVLFISLMVIALITILSGCTSNENKVLSAESGSVQQHYLYLDFDYRSNLFLAKYEVEVYIDGVECGTVDNGGYFSTLVKLNDGDHILSFYKKDDHKVFNQEVVTLTHDLTYSGRIKSRTSAIAIDRVTRTPSVEGFALVMPKLEYETLDSASDRLSRAGFTDVVYVTADDLSVEPDPSWIVADQSIEPGDVVDRNERIRLICTSINDTIGIDGVNVPAAAPEGRDVSEAADKTLSGVYVFICDNSDLYHIDPECCDGEYSVLITWEEAILQGKIPCSSCCSAVH